MNMMYVEVKAAIQTGMVSNFLSICCFVAYSRS